MFSDIFNGISAYGNAFRLISRYRLWGYFIVPALICIVLGAMVISLAVQYGGRLGDWMVSWCHWEWLCTRIDGVADVLGGLFIGAIGLILFKNLVLAIASPFMSLLSERIEKSFSANYQEAALNPARMLRELIRGLRISLRNILRELLFTLILGFIPLVGPFLIFMVQAYYAGFGNMDYTLERHFNRRESVRFVRNNRGLAIGNGAVFLLMIMTVVGFLFALPLSTVAATTEILKRIDIRPGIRPEDLV